MKAIKRATCPLCKWSTNTDNGITLKDSNVSKMLTCPKDGTPLKLSKNWYAVGQFRLKNIKHRCGNTKESAEQWIADFKKDNNSSKYINPHVDRIRHLEEDLNDARQTIMNLMPENIQTILEYHNKCNTHEEALAWEGKAINQIIENAKLLTEDDNPYFHNRAYCPLCGRGCSGQYSKGFSVPVGLKRHLEGYGTVRQCDVMAEMVKLTRQPLRS